MVNLGIGHLAKRTGVPIDTIRYYERIGLLRPASRLASGYRRYGDPELRRLQFVLRAKALGFTLEEIEGLLALSAGRSGEQVKRRAAARLEDVERRILELARIRDSLRKLISACPGHGRAQDCPILNALGGESMP